MSKYFKNYMASFLNTISYLPKLLMPTSYPMYFLLLLICYIIVNIISQCRKEVIRKRKYYTYKISTIIKLSKHTRYTLLSIFVHKNLNNFF